MNGRTVLGEVGRVEGLQDGLVDGVRTPEYRAHMPSGVDAILEVKATNGLSKNSLKNNLTSALDQVRTQRRQLSQSTGYIRIDASIKGVTSSLAENDIYRIVNRRFANSSDAMSYIIEIKYLTQEGLQTITYEASQQGVTKL